MNSLYIYVLAIICFLITLAIIGSANKKFKIISTKLNFYKKTKQSSQNKSNSSRISEISDSSLKRFLNKLYALSLPPEGWQDSKNKLKFVRAGLREEVYFKFFYFLKSALTFGFFVLVSFLTIIFSSLANFRDYLPLIFASSVLIYFSPDIYLFFKTKKRQEYMEVAIPNFLDLLLICSESGLSLDAGLSRVSTELGRTSPELSEEVYLTLLEIRAGAERRTCFDNLALRVNSDYMVSIVSMFNQVDAFGTSLGDSLRVHSDIIRSQRLQKAENFAAKLPLKMLFPLITCLFPIVIIVLIGPSIIAISAAFASS